MKKLLLSIIFSLMLLTSVSAGEIDSRVYQLKDDSSGDDISSFVMTSGTPVNTRSLYMKDNIGFAALLVTVDASGSVTIYAEYSVDGTNWYRPYVSDMAGATTIEGNIVTTLGNTTEYIIYTPRLAPFSRLVFSPAANSTVTAQLIYQKDR